MHQQLAYEEKKDPWSSHSVIQKWLSEAPPGSRVLDIGAASGFMGRRMESHGLIFHGIEPDENAAFIAKPYYEQIFVSTIEDTPGEQISDFDIIILADILEHLADPESVLRNLVNFQHENAKFLISVPNIANLWIRLNLLLGKFDYSDRGILDRTHLRFFTRRSFFEFLNEIGLEVEAEKVTPVPLSLVHPFFINSILGQRIHQLLAVITNWIPTVLGYQFVVMTKISPPGTRRR